MQKFKRHIVANTKDFIIQIPNFFLEFSYFVVICQKLKISMQLQEGKKKPQRRKFWGTSHSSFCLIKSLDVKMLQERLNF